MWMCVHMHVCVLRPVISIRRPERMGENFPLDTGPETQRSALSDGSASSSLGGGASPHNISTPRGVTSLSGRMWMSFWFLSWGNALEAAKVGTSCKTFLWSLGSITLSLSCFSLVGSFSYIPNMEQSPRNPTMWRGEAQAAKGPKTFLCGGDSECVDQGPCWPIRACAGRLLAACGAWPRVQEMISS